MPDRSTAHIIRTLLAAALLLPLWAQAQTEPLYQVELLVFSRPAGAAAEHWDATPDLAYPAISRFLIYPGEQQAQPPPAVPSLPAITETSAPAEEYALPGPAPATLFATLPAGQRQFAGRAATMQNSGRYRILFHETWIQPIGSQAQALPIVLDRSGDGGAWPALQGSIKLYQSGYLYLETNLWLNTQGEYLKGSWRMPAPPLAPVSPAREAALHTEPHLPATAAPAGGQATSGERLSSGPEYPFRHAVLLKETRRMRSGEVVYIDHPLLGVLVKITALNATPEAASE